MSMSDARRTKLLDDWNMTFDQYNNHSSVDFESMMIQENNDAILLSSSISKNVRHRLKTARSIRGYRQVFEESGQRSYYLRARGDGLLGNRYRFENPENHHPIRHGNRLFRSIEANLQTPIPFTWPIKKEAVVEGDLILGGLMMVHEREDSITCGPVMPQGGVQALETMLYTLDWVNKRHLVPGVKIGAHILDDCDKDTYGLEMAVDFIKG